MFRAQSNICDGAFSTKDSRRLNIVGITHGRIIEEDRYFISLLKTSLIRQLCSFLGKKLRDKVICSIYSIESFFRSVKSLNAF